METAAFVVAGPSPAVFATPAPARGLPRQSARQWQGAAGPCAAAAAAAVSAAVTRRARNARIARSAKLSDNPWEDINKRNRVEGQTQAGAPWFMPGWGGELDQDPDDEEELDRKKPVEESVCLGKLAPEIYEHQ
ncbi:FXR2 [Symbiodinium natans]|uniref:FXR2 protein n=1 Tax=Symbiodinium natans TaxID=878477 RepID=A0A812H4C4_9DINO|nr:FXR2 [Symbiodinium natans]